MIETFRNWINILLCLGIFITIIQLIMPKNKLRKYIYSLVGIVTIITIVSPVMNLLKNKNMEESLKQVISNIDTGENSSLDVQKYKDATENAVKTSFVNSLKVDVTNRLSQNGVEVIKTEIFVDSEYNIEKVEINVKKLNEDNVKLSSVTQVVKYINEEYDIDLSKIIVIEEGI